MISPEKLVSSWKGLGRKKEEEKKKEKEGRKV
jgi:hypothetical protein